VADRGEFQARHHQIISGCVSVQASIIQVVGEKFIISLALDKNTIKNVILSINE
jgi:hypothetical protein